MGRKRKIPACDSGDRTTYLPPCRVCDGPAGGFHYGVNTCEACKGFFHRSFKSYMDFHCDTQGNCEVNFKNSKICKKCRYNKCITVGMAKQAIKTGRYTVAKRTKDTLEIKSLKNGDAPKYSTTSSEHQRFLGHGKDDSQALGNMPHCTQFLPSPDSDRQHDGRVLAHSIGNEPDCSASGAPTTRPSLFTGISYASPGRYTQDSKELCSPRFYSAVANSFIRISSRGDNSLSTSELSDPSGNCSDIGGYNGALDMSSPGSQSSITSLSSPEAKDSLTCVSRAYQADNSENIGGRSRNDSASSQIPIDLSGCCICTCNDISHDHNHNNNRSAHTDNLNDTHTTNCTHETHGFSQSNDSPSGIWSSGANSNTGCIVEDGHSDEDVKLCIANLYSSKEGVVSTLLQAIDDHIGHLLPTMSDEELRVKAAEHVDGCKLKQEMFGTMARLPDQEYDQIYASTGIDADGRQLRFQRINAVMETQLRAQAKFAKAIPGFSMLDMADQVMLIKYSRCESLFILGYHKLDLEHQVLLCGDGKLRCRMDIVREMNGGKMLDDYCALSLQFGKLGLTPTEKVVLAAAAIMAPDRVDLVKCKRAHLIHEELNQVFIHLLSKRLARPLLHFSRVVSLLIRCRSFSSYAIETNKRLRMDKYSDALNNPVLREMLDGIYFDFGARPGGFSELLQDS